MEEICVKEKCTGCSACFNACNQKAITMSEDACGFYYPKIDPNLCIDCGLCTKVCPVNTKPTFKYPLDCYAATVKSDKELLSCASGGLATELSRYIINKGGVVYGCTGKDIRNVHHIRINKIEDIELLKGSKYVQSFIGGVYKDVKNDLQTGCFVLFIGTPCQVAGLKGFLRHKDYQNLIIVDLACHGVPSQKMLNDNISLYCAENVDISVSFRKKVYTSSKFGASWRIMYGWFYQTPNMHTQRTIKYYKDPYMFGFLAPLTLRSSCYICPYANISRCGDFTLGDFWGLGKNAGFVSGKGVSVVLVNTNKAASIWTELSKNCVWVQRDIVEAQKGNGQFKAPSLMHKNYKNFISSYPQLGLKHSILSNLRRDKHKIIINNIKLIVKNLIKYE